MLLRETLVLRRSNENGGALRSTLRAGLGGRPLQVEDLDLTDPALRSGPGVLGTARVLATATLLGTRPGEPLAPAKLPSTARGHCDASSPTTRTSPHRPWPRPGHGGGTSSPGRPRSRRRVWTGRASPDDASGNPAARRWPGPLDALLRHLAREPSDARATADAGLAATDPGGTVTRQSPQPRSADTRRLKTRLTGTATKLMITQTAAARPRRPSGRRVRHSDRHPPSRTRQVDAGSSRSTAAGARGGSTAGARMAARSPVVVLDCGRRSDPTRRGPIGPGGPKRRGLARRSRSGDLRPGAWPWSKQILLGGGASCARGGSYERAMTRRAGTAAGCSNGVAWIGVAGGSSARVSRRVGATGGDRRA